MHSLEALEIYSQHHPRWFESIRCYSPTREHLDELERVLPRDWHVRRGDWWYFVAPPDSVLPPQGWKLHVSASTDESVDVLRRALPVLRDEAATFKVVLDPRVAAWMNGKNWPRGGSGKLVTIYPSSLERFHRIGRRLCEALRPFAGPYILSDRRWPGSASLHYRYGGFSARSVLEADGTRRAVIVAPSGALVPDPRMPYWEPPAWVQDPFPEPPPAGPATRLGDDRFAVTAALGFSNRGGVYKAIDFHTGKEVVLKEARPRVEIGSRRLDAIAVLEKEHRLLARLGPTGRFVRPVAFLRTWEHAFLVEEFVAGEHLGRFAIRHDPLYAGGDVVAGMPAYLERMRGLWLQIAQAIAAAHRHDIALGDLSFTNVLVGEGDRVVICDLETATEGGSDLELGLHTPGMSAMGVSARANDYHALGMLVFGSIMLAHGMSGFHPPSRRRFLDELSEDLALPDPLVRLVDELVERPDRYASSPELATAALERLDLRSGRAPGRPARAALPIRQRLPPQRRQALRERVRTAVDGIASYLEGTADTSRTDRLFPADLMVFETNPLSVAHGAMGVLHALWHIRGRVPAPLVDWVLARPVTSEAYPPGLYTGQAGIAWVLGELGHVAAAAAMLRRAGRHELLLRSPGVLHGAAGFGMACLELWRRGGGEDLLGEAIRIGARLTDTCVRDERGARWPDERGEVPVGYAYGGSGIALFLLHLSLATGDPAPLRLGREALELELAQGVWLDGAFAGFPSRATERAASAEAAAKDGPGVLSCYWDTGSAGIGTTVARYVAATGDEALRRWLLRLADDASRKYVAFPQLFRGLAGLGNFLLDVWEQTRDEQHLMAAWQAAEGVLLFRVEREEGLAFPGEQARRESADFATGAAGVGLFLHRLLGVEQGARANFDFVLDDLLGAPSLLAPGA
jgi:hypothetical protein